MKATKAIEILELNAQSAGRLMPPDCLEALKLGIEALKVIVQFRPCLDQTTHSLLPGETPDDK